jgi:glycerol-3-phosphate acyltransferase PlsX
LARIALDAMGGDFAPSATVAGALLALAELDASHSVQLVGRAAVIEEQLAALLGGEMRGHAAHRARLTIVDAPDVIAMSDKPSVAIRGKTKSSMVVGLRLQADRKSDGFVSAGNTGAQMAASAFVLKLHAGLDRPAIATVFPTAKRSIVVLDSGANVDCSADELVQFARLGAVYAEDILGRERPAIGLMSIGEEPEKGNAAVKEAHQRLVASGLNFIGNVEGRDLPAGVCDRGPIDVVVCDGFVGNVMLKLYEGVAPFILGLVKDAGVDEGRLAQALKHMDYSETGGAPLLGVRGVSVICHGKSSERAIKNAVKVAVRAVDSRMDDHIGRHLAAGVAEPV